VRRLRFGTTAEVHAAVSMPTAPSSNSAPDANGAAVAGGAVLPGRVPGRAVLEVPGWQDSRPARAAAPHLAHPVRSRLRLFSGTSNPVSSGRPHGAGGAAGAGGRGQRISRSARPKTRICGLLPSLLMEARMGANMHSRSLA
jgi:hypothetical protein